MLTSKTIRNASLVMLFTGLCASSASVILPLLQEHYDLSYDFSGLLLAFLSAGNLAAALLCGFLPRFLGVRRTVLLLSLGTLVGYLLMLISGFWLFLILGFLLVGFGKGTSLNNATVAAGTVAKDRTGVVNLLNALYAGGSLLAPFLYLAFGGFNFWQLPLLLLAAGGGIVWVLFIAMKLDPEPAAAREKSDTRFLRDRHFWYSAGFLFGQQCAEISVTGWLVTYFKDQRILTGIFSQLTVTVIWSAMLIGRLLLAFVLPAASRFRSLTLMSVASLVTYLLMLMSSDGLPALITLFLFGLSISGAYPTVIATANRSMSNASVGVLLPVGGIGAILMPYITGAVAEYTGIRGGMMCSAAALVIMIVFSILMKRSETDAPAGQV